jgi:hypothetical protein
VLEEVFSDWSERDQAELARLTGRFADSMFALIEKNEAEREAGGEGPRA